MSLDNIVSYPFLVGDKLKKPFLNIYYQKATILLVNQPFIAALGYYGTHKTPR